LQWKFRWLEKQNIKEEGIENYGKRDEKLTKRETRSN
jgi:hypothetical protein